MISWCDRVYFSKNLKNRNKVRKAINNGETAKDVFCIAFASNEQNLFDIIPAKELLYPHYARTNIKIAGLADGREEAVLLVKDMLRRIYIETGDFKVRDFFI